MVETSPPNACAHRLVVRKATAAEPYHFTDVGLPDVYLTGIRYFVCQVCKQIVKVEIPALKGLLDAIARAIVMKESSLTGGQARYLRKRLGWKAVDFAGILRATPEQLSRWENGHNELSGATDRLIRLAYTFLSKDSKLKHVVQRVQEEFDRWSTSIRDQGENEVITAEYKANRQWVAAAAPIAA